MGATVHQFVQHVGGPHGVSQRPRSPYISEIEPGVPLGEYLVDPGGLTGDHLGGEPIQHGELPEPAATRQTSYRTPKIRAPPRLDSLLLAPSENGRWWDMASPKFTNVADNVYRRPIIIIAKTSLIAARS